MSRLPEQRAWDTLRAAVNPWDLLLHRIENQVMEGTPDVIAITKKNGTVFWIENKALNDWPARKTTCPLADSFEPGQLPFMRQWKHWKGIAFVLLRVDKEFFLLDPVLPLDKMVTTDIIANALVIGKKKVCEYIESL
jgi:penicillin-binding protein-related factor A (putative recombinase)